MCRADQSLCAVGPKGDVRKLGRPITAYPVSSNALYAKVQLLVKEGPPRAGAETAARARVVECVNGRRGGQLRTGAIETGNACAGARQRRTIQNHGATAVGGLWADHVTRIDAVPESADNAEDLIVAETRIEGCLDNEVGSFVYRIARGVKSVE